jgi:multimeric flavodoxin WrbA
MKITIINGNKISSSFDDYLDRLIAGIKTEGHEVSLLTLRDFKIQPCCGCFGCWFKTPGECVMRDESADVCRAVINSDFALWAAPVTMGFPSALLKTAFDKCIPLLDPYMAIDNHEAHHHSRYPQYPRWGVLLETNENTDSRDLELIGNILSRTALNFKTKIEFLFTTETAPETVISSIMKPEGWIRFTKDLKPIPGATIKAPSRLTLINGSPRGVSGNTAILLREFAAGTKLPYETFSLAAEKDLSNLVRAFEKAECVFFGFPLYTDAMPGQVKAFIDELEPFCSKASNPPLGFLVQSGFPEALHSRHVEGYLAKLAERLKSPYLGTIIKGNGEGVRQAPAQLNRKLFQALHVLGHEFSRHGMLKSEPLRKVAGIERFPGYLAPVLKVMLKYVTFPQDKILKENGAYERRLARPYLE